MTDRPILFSGPMVRALLEGRKTQTRRVLKIPTKGEYVRPDMGGWAVTTFGGVGVRLKNGSPVAERPAVWNQTTGTTVAPIYDIGDRLWVRELWRTGLAYEDLPPSEMGGEEPVLFEADGRTERWTRGSSEPGRLRQGMHMPRWASRLTLIVTAVRVQRLQEISAADAVAEGALAQTHVDQFAEAHAVDMFRCLWDGINADRGYGWDANPWVVALTFDVHHGNIDALDLPQPPATIGDGGPVL